MVYIYSLTLIPKTICLDPIVIMLIMLNLKRDGDNSAYISPRLSTIRPVCAFPMLLC